MAPVRAPVRQRRLDDALQNLVVLALGSALAIVFGFILAAMVEREKRGEGVFRTIFLYPLAISLIVTGLVWRWMFNPSLGIQGFLHDSAGTSATFNWLAKPDTAMYAIILASIWHGLGFYMALMLAGPESRSTPRSGAPPGSTASASGGSTSRSSSR